MRAAVLCAVALCLAGCASAKLTPEQSALQIKAFHDAGCGGRIDLDAGVASGQLGGEGHITLGLHGECPAAVPITPGAVVVAAPQG